MSGSQNQDSLRTIAAISLFTEDLPASKAFYVKAFGATVVYEDPDSCAVEFSNLLLNLLRVEAAADLVGHDNVGRRNAGNRFQLSVWVSDVEAEVAKLKQRGVVFLQEPKLMPWDKVVATFEDPAGHNWEIAEP